MSGFLGRARRRIRAQRTRGGQPGFGEVDRDDSSRAVEAGADDGGEPDRARTDHDDGVAGPYAAVQHPDLIGGREDVGEQHTVMAADRSRQRVHGQIGEGHPYVFGLGAVDGVAEHPAAPTAALPVVALTAEAAPAARGYARDQDPVTGPDRTDVGPGLDHCADGFVPQHPAGGHLGHVALDDVQVGPADGDDIDADHRVGGVPDHRIRNVLPRDLPRALEYECLHDAAPLPVSPGEVLPQAGPARARST